MDADNLNRIPQWYINLDRQSDQGLVLEVSSRLNKKLSVQAYYSYTTGAVHTRIFENRDTRFDNLIRRPKNKLGAGMHFDVTKNLFTEVTLKSVGKRKDIFFDPDTFESLPVNLLALSTT